MRFSMMIVGLLVVFSVSDASAQEGGGGPSACTCLMEDGTFSCNTYGAWSENPEAYPCTTVLCSNGACPLLKEATKTRERVSGEAWDTTHPKYRPAIAPNNGQELKLAETGYLCFHDNFCSDCAYQEPRPTLPAGDYCKKQKENITGLGKYLVCKDAQGNPLPPCSGAPGE